MADVSTLNIPPVMYMIHTSKANEFYLDANEALAVKSDLDEEFKAQKLSRRTPMYRVTLDYEVYQ